MDRSWNASHYREPLKLVASWNAIISICGSQKEWVSDIVIKTQCKCVSAFVMGKFDPIWKENQIPELNKQQNHETKLRVRNKAKHTWNKFMFEI